MGERNIKKENYYFELDKTYYFLSTGLSDDSKANIVEQNHKAFQAIVETMNESNEKLKLETKSKIFQSYCEALIKIALQQEVSSEAIYEICRLQFDTYEIIKRFRTTDFTKSIEKAVLYSDYYGYREALQKVVNVSEITASDFAFLKSSDLNRKFIQRINTPNRLKSAVYDFNVASADRIANCDTIFYDVASSLFVSKQDQKAVSTPKEMNVVCSGAALFQDLSDQTDLQEEYLSEEELMGFMTLLQDRPTFASDDRVGQIISKLISEVAKRMDFDKTAFYHSRPKEKEAPFTYDEMLTAPSGLTGPGRYNHPGQAFYYFADTIEGAETEVKRHNKDRLIQTVEIKPTKEISMIDLSGELKRGQTFLKYIRFEASGSMPKEYLIPCYVSDCCRNSGIEGIKYYGSKQYSNYVCWNAGYFKFVKMIC